MVRGTRPYKALHRLLDRLSKGACAFRAEMDAVHLRHLDHRPGVEKTAAPSARQPLQPVGQSPDGLLRAKELSAQRAHFRTGGGQTSSTRKPPLPQLRVVRQRHVHQPGQPRRDPGRHRAENGS